MTTQRYHVYDLLGPTQTLGPGRAYRARAAEATNHVGQGTEVLLRVIDLATAGSEDDGEASLPKSRLVSPDLAPNAPWA